MADETLAEGGRPGLPALAVAVAVAVAGARAVVRVLVAEDDVALLRPDIAVAKTWGPRHGPVQPRHGARAAEAPAFFAARSQMPGGRVVPVPGRLPVTSDREAPRCHERERRLGASGVSGTSSDDEACALAPWPQHHKFKPCRSAESRPAPGRIMFGASAASRSVTFSSLAA